MNKKTLKIKYCSAAILIALVLILSSSTYSFHGIAQTMVANDIAPPSTNAPITNGMLIASDADFGPAGYNFPGDGSPSTPWEIKHLEINTTDVTALRIQDTTDHFIIENCTITSAFYGIYINNVADSTAHVKNNTVYDCSSLAIFVRDANGTYIEDNILNNNWRGMEISDSYLVFIHDNYLASSDAGIFLKHSPYASVLNNEMHGDGFELDFDYVANLVTLSTSGNTVNNKPLYFSISETGVNIPGDNGQIVVINGTSITIEGQTITNIDIGLSLWFSSFVDIINCDFIFSSIGCELFYSDDCTISSSTFSDASDGIYINQCADTIITLNYFKDSTDGVFATESVGILIKENTFHNNSDGGVYLDMCTNALVYWNNFTLNGDSSGYQAYDYQGTNNIWYETVTQTGNYWDDYNPLDDNYTVAGDPVNFDLYPLLTPYILIPEFSMIHLGFFGLLIAVISACILAIRVRKRKSF